MKTAKTWLASLLAVAVIPLAFTACGDKPEPHAPTTALSTIPTSATTTTTALPVNATAAWVIQVQGLVGITQFTSEEAKFLQKLDISMTSTNPSTAMTVTNTYSGVTLKSVLQYLGIPAVQNVTVTSANNYTVVYDTVMAMADDTLLAWEKDGSPMDSTPPLVMAPKTGAAEMYVPQVSSITIIPMDPSLLTTTAVSTLPTLPVYTDTYYYYPPDTTKRTTTQRTTPYVPGTIPTVPSDPYTTTTQPSTEPTAATTTTVTTTTKPTQTHSYVFSTKVTTTRTTTTRTTTTTTNPPGPYSPYPSVTASTAQPDIPLN